MKIFTFYKQDNPKISIHIGACTLFEAVDALTSLDCYAQSHYNLKEYKIDNVDPVPYLGIENEYEDLQYFISEKDYDIIMKVPQICDVKKIVNDKSDTKYNKYNSALLCKFKNGIEDAVDRINEKNSLESFDINYVKYDINNKQITLKNNIKISNKQLENKIKKDINKVLERYIGEFNNDETRENISNDISNVYHKYKSQIENQIKEANGILDEIQQKIMEDK